MGLLQQHVCANTMDGRRRATRQSVIKATHRSRDPRESGDVRQRPYVRQRTDGCALVVMVVGRSTTDGSGNYRQEGLFPAPFHSHDDA